MSAITLTRALALAAGQDAGNAQMRKAGRTAWNAEDWDTAAATVARLLGRDYHAVVATPVEVVRIVWARRDAELDPKQP